MTVTILFWLWVASMVGIILCLGAGLSYMRETYEDVERLRVAVQEGLVLLHEKHAGINDRLRLVEAGFRETEAEATAAMVRADACRSDLDELNIKAKAGAKLVVGVGEETASAIELINTQIANLSTRIANNFDRHDRFVEAVVEDIKKLDGDQDLILGHLGCTIAESEAKRFLSVNEDA